MIACCVVRIVRCPLDSQLGEQTSATPPELLNQPQDENNKLSVNSKLFTPYSSGPIVGDRASVWGQGTIPYWD